MMIACSDDCILAVLDRADFTRLCQIKDIDIWISRFVDAPSKRSIHP